MNVQASLKMQLCLCVVSYYIIMYYVIAHHDLCKV